MIRISFLTALFAIFFVSVSVKAQYAPALDKIKTVWGENLDVENVHNEYPRPIMERNRWKNLNGFWNYSILPVGSPTPVDYQGEILVPFAVESSLSGVGKMVGKENELWYKSEFDIPDDWSGDDVLLHFGAVDWKADVWVNGVKVGSHTGGYVPFEFNITPALNRDGKNVLVVRVWDPTDKGFQPRGKQVVKPGGIWYTPVTGIWQTVWLEPVAKSHISNLKILPDIDLKKITVTPHVEGSAPGQITEAVVYSSGKPIASGKSLNGEAVEIEMPDAHTRLWSPDDPYLYDLKVYLKENGMVVDSVSSYAAMRKFSIGKDENGIVRMMLNNEPLFQFGPLDQGWFPDGLYTAPSYDAMVFDLQKTKDLGFNMIRKHIKVEPATWYTYCDRNGIIVWQDMPSGDKNPAWIRHDYFDGTELKRSPESEANYRKEWKEIIDYLYSNPCIGVWVPFNEAWGQFKTPEIAEWTKNYDKSRLVNPASGGNFYSCGDILDLHNYPAPAMYLYDGQRANVLGEYGGIGYAVKDHLWMPDRNWGYIQFNSPEEVTDEYVKYANQLLDLVKRGFSAAVYTQTTDVEIEVNGLITYDRKKVKVDEKRIREINRKLCESLSK